VTELVGTDTLEEAPLGKRLGVRLHLLMCRHCRAYVRSLRQLADAARRLARVEPRVDEARVDEIVRAIRREGTSIDGGGPGPRF
jgi:predicted anti-sigma-YlaC factor YlaD